MGGWFNQSVRSMISIFARCFIERRVAACENRLFIIFSILAPNSFSFFSTAPQSDRTRWGRLDPGATGHMFDVGSFTFSFTFFYVRLLSFTNVSAGGLRRRVCLRLFTFVYFRLPNSVSKRHPLLTSHAEHSGPVDVHATKVNLKPHTNS